MILFGTQFSKLAALYGEPKEQMQWKCNEYKIKPKYHIEDEPQIQKVHKNLIQEEGAEMSANVDSANPTFIEAEMHTCSIIFRHGRQMCHSFGSTRRQAERNAAVMGLKWIEERKEELEAFCGGKPRGKDANSGGKREGHDPPSKKQKSGLETALKFTKFEDEELQQIGVKKMR